MLHLDRNPYYGGDSASLTLQQLWSKFAPGDSVPDSLGKSTSYNIDLVPKFMMANGKLVKVLLYTGVTRYLAFKPVDSSFVLKGDRIHKVPATDREALNSNLMGLFEKRRARGFFSFVQRYDENDPSTHNGHDLSKETMRELFRSFKLDANTIDFIGHALALREDDSFLDSPAIDTVKRIKLYAESLARFNTNAPFIYPLYGLGELPQAFARLSAVYGGTYMLDMSDAEVEYDNDGRASGVTSGGETAQASFVVGDPSFFPSKVKTVNKVARAYCILSHPVPNTDEAHSAQIILPQKQLGRSSDMYIFTCSHAYNVASKNKWIALVSATMEGRGDDVEAELQPGLRLLGQIDYKFFDVKEVKEPMNREEDDGCFISKGYDASTHFESTVDDVLDMYRRMTGEELDLSERDVNEAEVD